MSKRYRYMNQETLYAYVGTAMPAGTARDADMPPVEVYQHPQTGELYYRTVENFAERMTEMPEVLPAVLMAGQRTFERENPAMMCCEACRRAAFEAKPALVYRMAIALITCSKCGNKRCPKAQNHIYKCSGSNAVGQVGEVSK